MDIDFAWLEKHVFHRHLKADEKKLLSGVIRIVEFSKKADIMNEGEPADGLYLLYSGRAGVFHDSHGERVRVGEVSEGAQLGDMAIFDNQHYSATITTKTDCTAYHIPRKELEHLMADHYAMAKDIMMNTIHRLSAIVRGMNTVNAYSQQYIQGRRV